MSFSTITRRVTLGYRERQVPYDSDMPGVKPLDNTPDKINIDQRLASVLDIKPQLLRQLSPLTDAEDTSL